MSSRFQSAAVAAFMLLVSVLSDTPLAQSGTPNKLTPPPTGEIPVAFLLSEGATMIDFAGPWEVFQDVTVPNRGESSRVFRLFTVAETTRPIRATGGMKIVPDYTIANAPAPKVIVIPAQSPVSEAVKQWLRTSAANADVVMSVCTGAFLLASTGLLDGHEATTHHAFFRRFETSYPKVRLLRGKRFVEGPKLATAGGLTSGIDLALRVVERYFGRDVAERTVTFMEYQSAGWRDPNGGSNAEFANETAAAGMSICPVCEMDAPAGLATHQHAGKAYDFCGESCKQRFVAEPAKYVAERRSGGQQ